MVRRAPTSILLLVGGAALVGAAPRALASESVTSVLLEVDAPVACADSRTIWSAIARRTDRLREGTGDDAVVLHVTMRSAEGRVAGELRILRAGESAWRRTLTGTTCAEMVDALALVAALAFDPSGASSNAMPPSSPAPSSSEAPASSSPAAPVTAAPVTPTPAPAPVTRTPPPAPITPAPSVPSPARAVDADVATGSPAAYAWRFAVGGSAGTLALGTTSAPFAYGGLVELERDRDGLGPSFRLGVVHAEGSASAGAASARLAWTMARPSMCPLRFGIGGGVSVRPCAGVEVGAIHASPRGLDAPADRLRPWVAPILAGRLGWSPFRNGFVEGELALALPLVRDRFAADPSTEVYRAPGLVPTASIAVGARLP